MQDDTIPEPMQPERLRSLVRIALYAALVGAGAFIHVPVGPMHISLQPLMVMLAGFVLGPRRAALALLLYLLCGLIGLPMFGRGKAGPASFLGPTAGYFPGFVLGAVIAGFSTYVRGGRTARLTARIGFGLIGATVTLLAGTLLLWLRFIPDWNRAFLVGFVPFIGGDILKMLAAACIVEAFYPVPGEEGSRG